MVVGVLELELLIQDSASLKEKRKSVQSILAKLRNKFQVSANEVDYQDLWQRALLAVTCAGKEGSQVNLFLGHIAQWCEQQHNGAELLSANIRLFDTKD